MCILIIKGFKFKKGSIPKAIVNYTASKAPIDWVNNLKKACLGEKDGGKFNKKI